MLQRSNILACANLHFEAMSRKKSSADHPRIALAIAGGGPLGALHEIGALRALERSLRGIDFNQLHHYVGVSAGG